jgi:hypothetical protein
MDQFLSEGLVLQLPVPAWLVQISVAARDAAGKHAAEASTAAAESAALRASDLEREERTAPQRPDGFAPDRFRREIIFSSSRRLDMDQLLQQQRQRIPGESRNCQALRFENSVMCA